jgi:hypothetical protein
MPSTKNSQKATAARAQAAKSQKKTVEVVEIFSSSDSATEPVHEHEPDIECTGWSGGVNYVPSDSDPGGGAESGEDCNKDLEALEGQDLLDGLRNKWELLQQELEDLAKPTPYEHISKKTGAREWKKAEAKRALGYNGLSAWRKRGIAQKL